MQNSSTVKEHKEDLDVSTITWSDFIHSSVSPHSKINVTEKPPRSLHINFPFRFSKLVAEEYQENKVLGGDLSTELSFISVKSKGKYLYTTWRSFLDTSTHNHYKIVSGPTHVPLWQRRELLSLVCVTRTVAGEKLEKTLVRWRYSRSVTEIFHP